MGILIEHLSKSFGDKRVIEDLSFELPERGLVRISGASGNGKTTLLRMIAGLDKDYVGNIGGVGSVSFAFQEYRLFPWLSAAANITVAAFDAPTDENAEAARTMLASLGFSEEEMMLKPSQLSGGMKQRVSLARAFLRSSDVLILDEPSKELDLRLIGVLTEMMLNAAKEGLVIFVTHDPTLDGLDADMTVDIPKII